MLKNILIECKNNYISYISIAFFLAVWEAAGRFSLIDPIFISYPTKILLEGAYLFIDGKIWPHLVASLNALLAGLGLSVMVGTFFGLSVGSSRRLYDIFKPYIFTLNALPKVAVIPLIIIWFGIGMWSKIVVVFLMSLPPILINTIDGVGGTSKDLLKMAKSFGANRVFIMRTISFFNALPYTFSGMRIATGKGIIGLVVAEVFGYGVGIGYLVSFYGANFKTSHLLFVVVLLMIINLILIRIISIVENIIINNNN